MSNQPEGSHRTCIGSEGNCPVPAKATSDFCDYHYKLRQQEKTSQPEGEERFLRLLLHAMSLNGPNTHAVNIEVIKARLNRIGEVNTPMFPAYGTVDFHSPYAALFKECYAMEVSGM